MTGDFDASADGPGGGDGVEDGNGRESAEGGRGKAEEWVAAERLLTALHDLGVEHIFSNLGTDHTPLLEGAAAVRERAPGSLPEFVVCPHEFVAMSAAHGYAAATGDPQAVLVHVDVGTQNLGAAMHNAHRANAPVFVLSGLAPLTEGGHPGARDHPVHWTQDVFDQPGIVREYCRWTDEYRPPTDPATTVRRGLERATGVTPGPTYVSATREALESTVSVGSETGPAPRRVTASGADPDEVSRLVDAVEAAEAPLVVTGNLGPGPTATRFDALVAFAEAAGAGVVEHSPTTLSFPRDHPLHVGFAPHAAFDRADLVVVAGTDVPWVPAQGSPSADATVAQVDPQPTKPTYPRWSFPVDLTVAADPYRTLAAVAERLESVGVAAGERAAGWSAVHRRQREAWADDLRSDRGDGRLTPAVVSAAVDERLTDSAVVVEGAVTSRESVLRHLELSRPDSYLARGGAGLGWASGAGVGVKLARPDSRVVTLVGDGSYLFSNPVATAWVAAEYGAPTLTVVYNNRGWRAVRDATTAQHPDGAAADAGVPESAFDTDLDLSAPARAVGAHTASVHDADDLGGALDRAFDAVDAGTPAVLDVHLD